MFPTNLNRSATVFLSNLAILLELLDFVLNFGPDHGMFGLGHQSLMISPYASLKVHMTTDYYITQNQSHFSENSKHPITIIIIICRANANIFWTLDLR